MKKLKRKNLAELARQKDIISFEMQKTFIGGGNGTFHSPFTYEEYNRYNGGSEVYYINGSGILTYNLPDVEVFGY